MRRNLAVALLVSAVLIGGATVVRFKRSSAPTQATLTAVGGSAAPATPIEDFLAAKNVVPDESGTSSPDAQNLNETDLIGRQLVSDYLGLEANGQATPDQLSSLADSYGASVASLNTAPQITLTDVKTSDESEASYQAYSKAFLGIYSSYTTKLTSQFTSGSDFSQPGPGLTTFAQGVSNAYAQEAKELEALSVPPSVAPSHLKLVNTYLTAAWAMGAIANMQENPALALAAITKESDNAGAEKTALGEIVTILESHGITIQGQ